MVPKQPDIARSGSEERKGSLVGPIKHRHETTSPDLHTPPTTVSIPPATPERSRASTPTKPTSTGTAASPHTSPKQGTYQSGKSGTIGGIPPSLVILS